jgi:hypothetical protein
MRAGRKLGAQATAKRARDFYAEVAPKVEAMRQHGLSLAAIAETLNYDRYRTQRCALFSAVHVKRILDRAPGR